MTPRPTPAPRLTTERSIELAERFHALHTAKPVLRLANAWDVVSARLVEDAGAPAIATSSAAVAWSLGMPDGDRLGRDDALGQVRRIAGAVDIPVTADIESGFATDPDGVAETVRGVLAAGAVGVNLEDVDHEQAGLRTVGDQVERIAAARQAADATGIPLYVNARIDTYLRAIGPEETRLYDTLARASAYLAAGASGIFVPGVTDRTIVAALVEGIDAPLNLLVGPGAPSIDELEDLGVARASLGSSLAAAAYAVVRRSTRELLDKGSYAGLAGGLTYGELNALLA